MSETNRGKRKTSQKRNNTKRKTKKQQNQLQKVSIFLGLCIVFIGVVIVCLLQKKKPAETELPYLSEEQVEGDTQTTMEDGADQGQVETVEKQEETNPETPKEELPEIATDQKETDADSAKDKQETTVLDASDSSLENPEESTSSNDKKENPEESASSDDKKENPEESTTSDKKEVEKEDQKAKTENAEPEKLGAIALDGLSTETQNWGQGLNFDSYNRPAGCLNYQDKYGKYSAYFIVPNPNQKTIYLTFDEGYEYGCTPEILQVLKEKGVKAVFFITQSYAKKNPELVQQIIDGGHTLGNHSVTHPSDGLPSQSVEQQKEEIMGCHNYVKDNFGVAMRYFRYPAGKFSEQSLAIVNNCNYKSLFWSFAYKDYDVNNQPNEAESLQKLVDRMHPGAIYLLHAESTTNTHILGDFIDQGRNAGYSFELFSY